MSIQMQAWLVWALVGGSFFYATWALMPQIARRMLASSLLRLPLPGIVSAYCNRLTKAADGCHCTGCDHASAKCGASRPPRPSAQQPVLLRRR